MNKTRPAVLIQPGAALERGGRPIDYGTVGKPRLISDLLGQALKQHGLESGFKRGAALALWPEIAGESLSQLTEAERLEDGVLYVRVSDSVVGHQLTYMREEFLRRYREKLPGAVHELRFSVGRPSKGKKKAQPEIVPLPALSSEEEDRLRALAQQMPEALQGAIYKAARAVVRRQKASPHPPCVVCGSPSPENPCKSCQRLLKDPLIEKEARRLTRRPLSSRLDGEMLLAARYLAGRDLEAQLRELLPQVVREPQLLPMLQDTARRFLQLQTGQKDVTAYRHLLPETLQSLLKEV